MQTQSLRLALFASFVLGTLVNIARKISCYANAGNIDEWWHEKGKKIAQKKEKNCSNSPGRDLNTILVGKRSKKSFCFVFRQHWWSKWLFEVLWILPQATLSENSPELIQLNIFNVYPKWWLFYKNTCICAEWYK